MSNREVSCGKLINPHFVGVLVFITFNYFVFVVEYMLGLKPAPYVILLIVFHILFAMLLWSMIKSILGDPGRVPIYWGFFAEEADNRRRRYCLLCHSFKPERYFQIINVDAITVPPAKDAFSIWIIIVLGFLTASASLIGNFSCSSSFTSY